MSKSKFPYFIDISSTSESSEEEDKGTSLKKKELDKKFVDLYYDFLQDFGKRLEKRLLEKLEDENKNKINKNDSEGDQDEEDEDESDILKKKRIGGGNFFDAEQRRKDYENEANFLKKKMRKSDEEEAEADDEDEVKVLFKRESTSIKNDLEPEIPAELISTKISVSGLPPEINRDNVFIHFPEWSSSYTLEFCKEDSTIKVSTKDRGEAVSFLEKYNGKIIVGQGDQRPIYTINAVFEHGKTGKKGHTAADRRKIEQGKRLAQAQQGPKSTEKKGPEKLRKDLPEKRRKSSLKIDRRRKSSGGTFLPGRRKSPNSEANKKISYDKISLLDFPKEGSSSSLASFHENPSMSKKENEKERKKYVIQRRKRMTEARKSSLVNVDPKLIFGQTTAPLPPSPVEQAASDDSLENPAWRRARIVEIRKKIKRDRINRITKVEMLLFMLTYLNGIYVSYFLLYGISLMGITNSIESILETGKEIVAPLEAHTRTIGLLTMVSASLLFISCMLGGIGIIFWNKSFLVAYSSLTFIVLLFQLMLSSSAYFLAKCPNDKIKTMLQERFRLFGMTADGDSTEKIHSIQMALGCCGFNGFEDYQKSKNGTNSSSASASGEGRAQNQAKLNGLYPFSCCKADWAHNLYCAQNFTKENSANSKEFAERMNTKGCYDEVVGRCDTILKLIGLGGFVMVFVFAIVNTVPLILMFVLTRRILRCETIGVARIRARDRKMLEEEFQFRKKIHEYRHVKMRIARNEKRRIISILRKEGVAISDEDYHVDYKSDDTTTMSSITESDLDLPNLTTTTAPRKVTKLIEDERVIEANLEHRGVAKLVRRIRQKHRLDDLEYARSNEDIAPPPKPGLKFNPSLKFNTKVTLRRRTKTNHEVPTWKGFGI